MMDGTNAQAVRGFGRAMLFIGGGWGVGLLFGYGLAGFLLGTAALGGLLVLNTRKE